MEMALTFNNITFSPVICENKVWIRAVELAHALGYAQENSVSRIYRANEDEFTPDMSQVIEILDSTDSAPPVKSRIFSLRGCHLLAMLARTPVAKAFRKWVLDVLDRIAKEEQPTPTELPPSDQNIIQALVKAIADRYPEAEQKSVYMQVWMRFRNHFRIGSYKQLPPERMADAVGYLANLKIKKKVEANANNPAKMAEDKYEAYIYDVEAFRAETAAKIETLLNRGLSFIDMRKYGPGCIIAFTPILLDWLQRIAGQPNPILRRNEPVSRAIDYSPLYLIRHTEKMDCGK